MARGVQLSPWMYQAVDYQDNVIRITVTFDNTTRALSGATIFRDAACVYTKIYVGLGNDGQPDSTLRSFVVPVGSHVVSSAMLSVVGLKTIEDILAFQITAGP